MAISPLPAPDSSGPPPAPLADALDRVLAGLGAPPAPVLTTLRDRWEELVGPAAAANSRPGAVHEGCLRVEVTSSSWASQLRWVQTDVLRRADALVGEGVISRLELRVTPG